jgi:hypothetical protein
MFSASAASVGGTPPFMLDKASLVRHEIESHIEAALELKIFCEVVILSASTANAANRLVSQAETYQACRNAALRAAGSINDEFARNFALQQIIRLCCSFSDYGSALAISDLISDEILRERVLAELPAERVSAAPRAQEPKRLPKPAWSIEVEQHLVREPRAPVRSGARE